MSTEHAFEHLYSTYFGDNQHEREEIENLPTLLRGQDVFIDVGASLGMFTYYANKAMNGGHIVAVEADPERFEELKGNCARWELEGTNRITAVHAAAGNSDEPVRFYITSSPISGGFFPVAERSSDYRPIDVRQIRLDQLHPPGVPTLVKVDVEGVELRVLEGSSAHLDSGTTSFLVEMHWWGDRENRATTLDTLRFLLRRRMHIKKTVRVHTSNYLIWRADAGDRVVGDYLRVAPLLLAKAGYGRFAPAWARNLREARLNRRRRRRHASSPPGSEVERAAKAPER